MKVYVLEDNSTHNALHKASRLGTSTISRLTYEMVPFQGLNGVVDADSADQC